MSSVPETVNNPPGVFKVLRTLALPMLMAPRSFVYLLGGEKKGIVDPQQVPKVTDPARQGGPTVRRAPGSRQALRRGRASR